MSNSLASNNSGSNNMGIQQLSVLNTRQVQMVPNSNHLGSNNLALQQLSVLNKRSVQMIPNSGMIVSPHLPGSNKRTIQMMSSSIPGSQKLPVPIKPGPHIDPMSGSMASRKPAVSSKRAGQMAPSPKGKAESFESVRSKMRESLAGALALVSDQQNKSDETNSQVETASVSRPSSEDSQPSESISATADVGSGHMPENPLENLSSRDHECEHRVNDDLIPSQEIFTNDKKEDSAQASNCDGQEASIQASHCDDQEFQLKYVMLDDDDDVSFTNNFLMKDDLLQGNGLCWASDLDLEISIEKETHDAKRPKLELEVSRNEIKQEPYCPQTLSTKIEAELFKLYGGVNKKYKEKGRSLLFNLKDPSNPDLRERVISGEISPERLCSMTAEELASKELSEWRIAKAEEFAQMVVLPDSEVDIRRLVRKTHKGEFQVEFEQDDGASVEVTVGDTLLSQFRPKAKKSEAQVPPKSDESEKTEKSEVTANERVTLDDQINSTLSTDGTDLMQGLIIDEMKDAEFLPPIVSLDEFMESLDSEPPFDNLPINAAETSSVSEEVKSPGVVSKLESSDLPSTDSVATALEKSKKVESKNTTHNDLKLTEIHIETETPPQVVAAAVKEADVKEVAAKEVAAKEAALKDEPVWEGTLQLNVSSVITIMGYFKSGEKTSAKEWPSFLDIKGRVRLDAFEKFLQELRMSRSRAIMVVHFCLKDGSPDSGRGNLTEVVESYIADERVGFAEPAPGIEVYFCPPHIRTVEMLGKHLTKDQTETLNALDNGLIGIVVWRKALVTSTISPNSSSHHKHSSKKQHNHSRRQQEKELNSNSNPKASILGPPPRKLQLPPSDEPIDDIPPGFGPGSARDDDDLPEFEFVRGSNPSVSQLSTPNPSDHTARSPFAPPEEMRQLIHKYGRGGMGGSVRGQMGGSNRLNWSQSRGVEVDDDDDDIPEWQPQQELLPPPPPPPPPPPLPQQQQQQQPQQQQLMHGYHQPMLTSQMMNNQHMVSVQPQQLIQQFLPQYTHNPTLLQPLQQPQMSLMQVQGQVPQTVFSQWQPGMWAPQSGPIGQTIQGNVLMQPCNNNNSNTNNVGGQQPYEGQFYGSSSSGATVYGTRQNGSMDWRPDVPRNNSRGF